MSELMNEFTSISLTIFDRGYGAIHGNEWGTYLGKLEDGHMVGFQGII